jgi:hypothetical protein
MSCEPKEKRMKLQVLYGLCYGKCHKSSNFHMLALLKNALYREHYHGAINKCSSVTLLNVLNWNTVEVAVQY